MRFCASLIFASLVVASGCGDSGGGESVDDGGPLRLETPWTLRCTIDTNVLELAIDATYTLDREYTPGASSDLTFAVVVTIEEPTAMVLIDAGVTKIDIISMDIGTWVVGATPIIVETLLSTAPINDLDLEVDTDDNGVPGPHRLELDDVTVASTVIDGAVEVELGLSLDLLSMILGDFDVPDDCENPTLVGFSAVFPVVP